MEKELNLGHRDGSVIKFVDQWLDEPQIEIIEIKVETCIPGNEVNYYGSETIYLDKEKATELRDWLTEVISLMK